ncbi:hypothetical protein CYMTET_30230 [Cymbomonas tetramitiformis]|uniref:Uncharacterized protein n=1 Tax=Cymbomonas tetramitiformis TaxID=36881 RepID=A0AAE0KU57_9CHLO|nr:hypothetical protein CYMTET_30230 [Cymbomonas tetramitiformis]
MCVGGPISRRLTTVCCSVRPGLGELTRMALALARAKYWKSATKGGHMPEELGWAGRGHPPGRTGFVILDVKEENMFLDQVSSGGARQMRVVLIDLNLRPSHMDDSQAIWFNVRRSLFKIFQHVAGLEDTDDIQAFPFAASTAKKMAELGMDELHTQPGMLKWMEHCNWGVFGNVEDKVRRAAADVLRGLASRDACDTELGHIGFLPFLVDDEIHSKHWDTIPEYFSRLPNYTELE